MTEGEAQDYVARLKHDWQLRKSFAESEVIEKARRWCFSMIAVGMVGIVFRLKSPIVSGFDYGTLAFVILLTLVFPTWKLIRLSQARRALCQVADGSSRLSGTK